MSKPWGLVAAAAKLVLLAVVLGCPSVTTTTTTTAAFTWPPPCGASPLSAVGLLEHVYHACPSHATVDRILEEAHGTKAGYFSGLHRAFPLVGGTGFRDSGVRINTTAKVCFFGDSVTRELAEAWKRIAPGSVVALKTDPHAAFSCRLLSEEPPGSPARAKLEAARRQWLMDARCDAIFFGGLGPHCLLRFLPTPTPSGKKAKLAAAAKTRAAEGGGGCSGSSEVEDGNGGGGGGGGGNGGDRSKEAAALALPKTLAGHAALVAETFQALAEVAAAGNKAASTGTSAEGGGGGLGGVTAVLVGSPVVEGEVLNLPPTKGDAARFQDFALLKLWALGERAAATENHGPPPVTATTAATAPSTAATATTRAGAATSAGGPSGAVPTAAAARGTSAARGASNVLFLDVASLGLRCPGWRCDGMHADKPMTFENPGGTAKGLSDGKAARAAAAAAAATTAGTGTALEEDTTAASASESRSSGGGPVRCPGSPAFLELLLADFAAGGRVSSGGGGSGSGSGGGGGPSASARSAGSSSLSLLARLHARGLAPHPDRAVTLPACAPPSYSAGH